MFNDDTSTVISQRIKEERKKRGLSQEKLHEQLQALGIKISLPALKSYETVEKHHSKFNSVDGMNIKFLYNLAEFFGVSTDYLLGLTETRTPDVDVQKACITTGLSEKAVLSLQSMSKTLDKELDFIVESPQFKEMARILYKAKMNQDILEPTLEDTTNKIILGLKNIEGKQLTRTERIGMALSDMALSPFFTQLLTTEVINLFNEYKEVLKNGEHQGKQE
ncbi:helix-turn-helix domain-containing protein [Ruminococcus flavefaciens]|uniref:helix-turn-helix domain-containing protein n=1 Tax=Ruminococcus flavefaciens TaxID=1265 RepID=UPI0026E9267A|nr:helix-turn-helix transcriptional regulator [Ruminococcus flavefaciens]